MSAPGPAVPTAHPHLSAGLAAAAFSAASFGLSAPFARPAAGAGVMGADLIMWRVSVMAVLLGLIALALRRPLLPPRAAWPGIVLFALCTVTIGTSYLSAIAYVPVGIAVLIFYTFPLIILLASPFVDRRRPTLPQLAAFVLAFAGLLLAIGPEWTTLDPRGLVLAGIASLVTAIQVFTGSRMGRRLDPVTFGFSSLLIMVPFAFLVALFAGGPANPATLSGAIVPLAIIVCAYVVGYVMQIRAMRLAPPSAVGLVYTLEPVVAISTAAVLLSERLVTHQYMGVALVLVALIVSVLPSPAARAVEPAR